ncbi:MAG: hypothetical protein CME06_11440 [Gemmatimonadetes bacterium]|nr:hypothetical protein [Gemmatimonadota bacterium]
MQPETTPRDRTLNVAKDPKALTRIPQLVERATTEHIQTETGTTIVSTLETTAFDAVRFPAASLDLGA